MSRINEIVNFLEANAPAKLAELRSINPAYAAALVPDICGVQSPATLIRAETALLGLRLWAPRLAELLIFELRRVKHINAAEDVALLTTAVGAGISALVASRPEV